MSASSPRIADHFAPLTDPRRKNITHPLINLVTIALCGSIAGADDFVTMVDWAQHHQEWLAGLLDLSNGLPSHDTLNHFFRRVDPHQFERCLHSWLAALHDVTAGKLIAIDGKTQRGSFDKATAQTALHMVGAWAVSQQLSLGCVVVDKKSNEITAIPELLQLLDLTGAIVSIDAMGCQTEIAETIVDRGGDFLLAVKKNQRTLWEGITDHFCDHLDDDFARVEVSRHETREKGHGRKEHRTYFVLDIPVGLADAGRWKGLQQMGMAINDVVRDGKECDEVRYYILSRKMTAKRFGTLVRGHWGIENSLHWQLDMSFSEDGDRTRKDHASANLGALRRTALSLLKRERSAKNGIKGKRLIAGWNTSYLSKVLFGA